MVEKALCYACCVSLALALAGCSSKHANHAVPGNVTPSEPAANSNAPRSQGANAGHQQDQTHPNPPSLDGFADSAQHFRNRFGSRYARFAPDDVVAIGDNILLHQRANGGWSENWDPQRILSGAERAEVASARNKLDTSFDNRSTYSHVAYLADVFVHTRLNRFRDGCLRGLDFMLQAQHRSGGFPHSFPGSQPYHHHITFMDDVTPDALSTLKAAARGEAGFSFLDPKRRTLLAEAVERGEQALLKLQVLRNATLTVWAGQYDADTLEPTHARSYELPGLVSRESLTVVRYLMSIEPPSAEIARAIHAAVAWYERVKITGLKVEEFPAPLVKYEYHTSSSDRRVISDPSAPPIWARFYEIDTNRPFMANRDGTKVYALAEVDRERRTGYAWYSYQPATLLQDEYPAWQTRWARELSGAQESAR